jgi:cell division protein ZapA
VREITACWKWLFCREHRALGDGDNCAAKPEQPVDKKLATFRPFPWVAEGATVPAMGAAAPVELRVGGQTYRVLASAEETELRRLADMVDARLRELVSPGRQIHPQALLLAAIALAHDLEQERERRQHAEQRSREMLSTLLARIDAALDATDAGPTETELPHHDTDVDELRPLDQP